MIAPFAPGGAKRLRAVLRLLNGNFSAGNEGRHPPQHALRLPGQRHEVSLRDRLRRRSGTPTSRTSRRRFPTKWTSSSLRSKAGRDSQPEGERLDRQAPDPRRRLVRRPSGSDGGGDRTAEARRQGGRRIPRQGWIAAAANRSLGSGPDGPVPERMPMLSVRNPAAESFDAAPTLDLHEIQATVLRPRPAPYFGTHVLLRVDDAQAGRAFLRRLTPYVDSAADSRIAANAWLDVGISYTGLEALGLSQEVAAELSRGVSRRDGGARTAAWRRWASTIRRIGTSRSAQVKSISA